MIPFFLKSAEFFLKHNVYVYVYIYIHVFLFLKNQIFKAGGNRDIFISGLTGFLKKPRMPEYYQCLTIIFMVFYLLQGSSHGHLRSTPPKKIFGSIKRQWDGFISSLLRPGISEKVVVYWGTVDPLNSHDIHSISRVYLLPAAYAKVSAADLAEFPERFHGVFESSTLLRAMEKKGPPDIPSKGGLGGWMKNYSQIYGDCDR